MIRPCVALVFGALVAACGEASLDSVQSACEDTCDQVGACFELEANGPEIARCKTGCEAPSGVDFSAACIQANEEVLGCIASLTCDAVVDGPGCNQEIDATNRECDVVPSNPRLEFGETSDPPPGG